MELWLQSSVSATLMLLRTLLALFLLAASTQARPEILVAAARAQIGKTLSYDPAYVRLEYPGGDVPIERGVCTDVVVRAFRQAGIDLQKEVHEDMKNAFTRYPRLWGLRSPDSNIDHRRVPNLMTFFQRRGKSLPVSGNPEEYAAGDIVAWRLPDGRPHIGLVSDVKAPDSGRPLVIHNIGGGAQAEDRLLDFEIIGHYRYW